MNRFRSKKKAAKEASEAAERASQDTDTPHMPTLKASKTFKLGGRKNSAPVVEPKLEIDLSTALPSSDDFRTSLLMNGLSARFSMLREQDDPTSKLGKASDDSVLFPKRQSRLDNLSSFSSNALHDIEEDVSPRTSEQMFCPPFARNVKKDSFNSHDGSYGADDDSMNGQSIMARAKPGEGNNLFGGRQKVYQIPVKSGAKGAGMSGRARYDDDVNMSAFQRFKERELQQQEQQQEQGRLAEEAAQTVRSSSPPLSGYNRNRETSSTTSSGPCLTRYSTSATSIHSQGPSPNASYTSSAPCSTSLNTASGPEQKAAPERAVTKARRLYETGLEKNLTEQQHSAMSRIDTISRRQNIRSQTPPLVLSPKTSVSNLSERFELHELSAKRSQTTASPPSSASPIGTFELALKPAKAAQKPYFDPPLSPPVSEGDDTSSSNILIDAKDRGKATALGAFGRPTHSYDDTKWTERQKQMQASRDTTKNARPLQQSPTGAERNRAESTTDSSRNPSASRQPFVPRNRIPGTRMAEPKMSSPPRSFPNSPKGKTTNYTFEESNSKAFTMPVAEENLASTAKSSPEFQDSRSRRLWADFTTDDSEVATPKPSILLSQADPPRPAGRPPADSPTLGPTLLGPTMLGPTTGLSGMVRQHLRSDSNTSSMLSSPRLAPEDSGHLSDVHEELNSVAKLNGINRISAVPPPLSLKSADEGSARPPPLAVRSPNTENFWTENTKPPAHENDAPDYHGNGGSTATQNESDTFTKELAQRRRRVQENLKSFVESDSRSDSPVPESVLQNDLHSLKNLPPKPKASRESMVGSIQVKSRRMLGLGNTTISSSQGPHNQLQGDDDMWQKEEGEMLRGLAKGPNGRKKDIRQPHSEDRQVPERKWGKESLSEQPEAHTINGHHTFREERQPQQNWTDYPSEGASERMRKQSASSGGPSRPSSRPTQDRSGSSKSRMGMYRDDLAKAMAEGMSSLTTQASYDESFASRPTARKPSLTSPSSTFASTSRGSNGKPRRPSAASKPGVGSYFDNQTLHPLQTGDIGNIGVSPRPSPATPFSLNSTPSLTSTGSGGNTPIGQAPGFQSRAPPRNKTVNKADISEPTLLSTTSQIDTVNLPPGASLKNGSEPPPPVPAFNPRRRQTRIQTMAGVFSSSKSSDSVPTMPSQTSLIHEEHSSFSGDDEEAKKPRKLHKSSSDGSSLASRSHGNSAAQGGAPAMPRSQEQQPSKQGAMF